MVRRLVSQFAPERIILFGSHARGEAGPDSDVDLLVIKPVAGSLRSERIAMRVALRGTGSPKDTVLATPEDADRWQHVEGTIIHEALTTGTVLYER